MSADAKIIAFSEMAGSANINGGKASHAVSQPKLISKILDAIIDERVPREGFILPVAMRIVTRLEAGWRACRDHI